MKYTVKNGMRYFARIKLGGFETLANNSTIIVKLKEAGFVDIQVTGKGSERFAYGTWSKSDASADMPSEIVEVDLISQPGGGKAVESETGGGAA